jgi:hypothetical protein
MQVESTKNSPATFSATRVLEFAMTESRLRQCSIAPNELSQSCPERPIHQPDCILTLFRRSKPVPKNWRWHRFDVSFLGLCRQIPLGQIDARLDVGTMVELRSATISCVDSEIAEP